MPATKRNRETMDEGSRKRAKVANGVDEVTESTDSGSRMVPLKSTDSLPPTTEVTSSSNNDESRRTLNLLHQDFDALRSQVTCKICERLLYEPYVLSCGHTYCYSCLTTWFVANRKKTCPNCRVVITQPPAPSYVIKEMVHVFVKRSELLPDGETTEQHEEWQLEEAQIVTKDKANTSERDGGLFKGCFTKNRILEPIHDAEDGVLRCPMCHHEIEGGMCLQCGIHFDSDTIDGYDSDEDVDIDEDDEDGFAEEIDEADYGNQALFDAFIEGGYAREFARQGIRVHLEGYDDEGTDRFDRVRDSEDDEEDSDEEHDSTMGDFIVSDDDDDDAGSEAPSASSEPIVDVARPANASRRLNRPRVSSSDPEEDSIAIRPARLPVAVFSSVDDSDSAPEVLSSRPAGARRTGPIPILSSDDTSSTSEPQVLSTGRSNRSRSRVLDSDDSDDSDSSSTATDDVHGPSPVQASDDEGEDGNTLLSDNNDDEDEDSEVEMEESEDESEDEHDLSA